MSPQSTPCQMQKYIKIRETLRDFMKFIYCEQNDRLRSNAAGKQVFRN